jgi:hypothetical protein
MLPTSQSPAEPTLLHMAFGGGTPVRALATAAVVGTVLTAINHGDVVVAGNFPPFIKVFLTYCVPYCVTTWGAIIGKRAQWRQDQSML